MLNHHTMFKTLRNIGCGKTPANRTLCWSKLICNFYIFQWKWEPNMPQFLN